MSNKIRVLVVDDSTFMRHVIAGIINSDPQLEVIATAKNGEEAIRKVADLRPDVITLDIEMPRMNGLDALKYIMKNFPTPVIVLSALTQEGAEYTFKALEYGAVDFIAKPSGYISLDLHKIRYEIISKIKVAASANLLKTKIKPSVIESFEPTERVIIMGASTGGPQTLAYILESLPPNIPPILIVQHMPEGFTKPFAERLNRLCEFEVKEAEEGEYISRGLVLVAPGGFHMTVSKTGRIQLHRGPLIHGVRPAVDPLMESAAESFGSKTIGVLLTGMGRDGAYGMKKIKEKGGFTIAQDKRTSVVFGMPRAAIEEGCVDVVLPLHKIPFEIMRRCRKNV